VKISLTRIPCTGKERRSILAFALASTKRLSCGDTQHPILAIGRTGDSPARRMDVSRFIVTSMAHEHVYSDPDWLSGDRLSTKLAVTRASGARHASVRFGSGYLDRVANRDGFLSLVQKPG
jgi:hypothetical protein